MTYSFANYKAAIGVFALTAALILAGCEGSDGADGEPGLPAGVDIANAAEINAVINNVQISSPAVVSFSLSDGNGNPIKNLPASAIGFNLVKLVPGTDGNSSAWQSYINQIEEPGVGPGTVAKTQATVENGTAGTLVDNQDGSYTYTFSFDINAVTEPVPVEYVPTLTHRVSFEIRGYAQDQRVGMNLNGELPGWCNQQGSRTRDTAPIFRCVPQQMIECRQQKGCGFAGPGLCLSRDIMALQSVRKCLRLNRRASSEPCGTYTLQELFR